MLKKIGSSLAVIGGAFTDLLRELMGLAGVGLISYGAWLILPAAGYIVGGVLLLAGSILLAMKR